MNPEQNEWQERPAFTFPCANCGSNSAEYDSPSKLCAECRTKFVRFPIPLWIKGFGLGIAIIVVLSLTKLPSQLSLGVSLERGKTAIEERNYFTAQQQLEDFTVKVPESEEGQAYLLIASFHNHDFEIFSKAYSKLEGKKVENSALYEEVSSLLNLADNYFPTDAFDTLIRRYDNDLALIPDTAYISFLRNNVNEVYASIGYANKLYNSGDRNAADSMLKETLKIDHEYMPALEMLAGLKREQDSFDVALRYCNKMLSINKQYPSALCSKARTLLKLKRDDEALKLAQEALELSSLDVYTQTTLALAYHYTNHLKERDEILQSARKTDTTSNGYAQHVLDVINGKENYR
jgi:tetratricopeptide (TPR) repeat protein